MIAQIADEPNVAVDEPGAAVDDNEAAAATEEPGTVADDSADGLTDPDESEDASAELLSVQVVDELQHMELDGDEVRC